MNPSLIALAWLAFHLARHHVPGPALLLACTVAALPSVAVAAAKWS